MPPRERIKSTPDTPYALVLGRFPPCAQPAEDTVATVAALLYDGHAVETVSLGGHGDAHLALDFAKAHALRSLRAAVRAGPAVDRLVIYPAALSMRRPDRLARAFALLQQLFTLAWLLRQARRVTVLPGRPGGWQPAAPLAMAVLRLAAIGRATAPPASNMTPTAQACVLAAAAWGATPPARLALEIATHLQGPLGVMLRPVESVAAGGGTLQAAEVAGPLTAALAEDRVWSGPNIAIPAWMVHLRAARSALPRLEPGSDQAARTLRGWALTELDGDGTLAGLRATLNGHGAAASPMGERPPAERLWREMRGAGALISPLTLPSFEDADAAEHRSWETAGIIHAVIKLAKRLTSQFRDQASGDDGSDDGGDEGPRRSPAAWRATKHMVREHAEQTDGQGIAPPTVGDGSATRMRALALALAAGLPDGLRSAEAPVGPKLARILRHRAARATDDAPLLQGVLAAAERDAPRVLNLDGSAPPSLRLIGHASAEMGLGANLAMSAAALAHEGVAVEVLSADNGLAPLPGPVPHGQPIDPLREATVLHVNADRVPQTLLHPRLMRGGHHGPAIGLLLWEFEVLPEAHALGIEMLDEIWAPTPFVADIYREAAGRAGTAVEVVHKALPGGGVAPMDRRALGLVEGPFVFLASFDFHSSVERKNPLALVRAFADAFPAGAPGAGDVALVLKTTEVLRGHWGDPHDQWAAISVAAAQDPRIRVMTGRLEAPVYRALLAAADCYVSPHRAEGFGYGPAEAMRLGRPVIATDWSGNTAFCSAETAYPVPAKLIPVAPGETIHPVPGARWAAIEHDAFVSTLRQVVQDESGRQARAAAGAKLMAERYGVAAHGARLRNRLTALGVLPESTAASDAKTAA